MDLYQPLLYFVWCHFFKIYDIHLASTVSGDVAEQAATDEVETELLSKEDCILIDAATYIRTAEHFAAIQIYLTRVNSGTERTLTLEEVFQ